VNETTRNPQHAIRNTQHAIFFTFYVLPFTFILAACGGGRSGYSAQQQTVDGLSITLERPQQIAVLQDYEFFVTLADAGGKPVDQAKVFLEQDMPAMRMISPQPLGEPLGNGQYRIKGVFTMEGAWHLTVHATVAGRDHTATFDQQVTVQQ
jgi:YtkA-like